MVQLPEPAVHGLGSRIRPRAWVARSPPPFLVLQQLFLQQPVTPPYQTLYGGQFKPSTIAIRAELTEHHGRDSGLPELHYKSGELRGRAS